MKSYTKTVNSNYRVAMCYDKTKGISITGSFLIGVNLSDYEHTILAIKETFYYCIDLTINRE